MNTPHLTAAERRRVRWSRWLATASTALLLAACGGGGDSSSDGSTASGLSVGTVTGFGSIIVDGVRYDDRRVSVSVDTESGAPDDSSTTVEVKLGQHVELTFTGSEDSSSASHVKVSAEIVGKVSATAPDLVVAGQTVKVNTDPAVGPVTVFEGYTSAADITIGDRVEVHGTPTAAHTVQATRIERRPSLDSWVRVAGNITGLASDGSSFKIGGQTVNVDAGTRLVPARATLSEGLRVVVWSATPAVGDVVTATLIRVKHVQDATKTDARVSGAISDCTPVCDASFKVGGIAVDASGAEFVNGTKADLANGKWVALRGTLDATGSTLVATKVVFRKIDVLGDVKLRGAITEFTDPTSFKVRGVPVTTDSSTTYLNCPSPLAQGTLVQVNGSISGFKVLAKKIECFTSPDGFIVEGKGAIATLDTAAKTFTLDTPLFAGMTLSYSDATRFDNGASAANLAINAQVEINGVVSGSTVTVTRIELEDHVPNPPPGMIFETKGVASNVVITDAKLVSFTVNGLDFTVASTLVTINSDGPVADGTKLRVLFRKSGTTNIALLVRTEK